MTLASAAQLLWLVVVFGFSPESRAGCGLALVAVSLMLAYPLAWVFVACPRCREPIGSSVMKWQLSSPRFFFARPRIKPPKDLTCVRCGAPLADQNGDS